MVQVHPHTPQSFICCKKIAWPPTRAWVNTEWCCGSPVMVQKLLIDTDDFLPPFFSVLENLWLLFLRWTADHQRWREWKLRLWKIQFSDFFSPIMEIGKLFVATPQEFLFPSLIDLWQKMVKPSMQASHIYSQGVPSTFMNPRRWSFKNVLWRLSTRLWRLWKMKARVLKARSCV